MEDYYSRLPEAWQRIVERFRENAGQALTPEEVESSLKLLERLEELEDVSDLMDLIGGTGEDKGF